MAVAFLNGLSNSEADSVVAVGYTLLANGLAGAIARGLTEDGACYVEILAPEDGTSMFRIGKHAGRYYILGQDGGRLAVGRSLDRLVNCAGSAFCTGRHGFH